MGYPQIIHFWLGFSTINHPAIRDSLLGNVHIYRPNESFNSLHLSPFSFGALWKRSRNGALGVKVDVDVNLAIAGEPPREERERVGCKLTRPGKPKKKRWENHGKMVIYMEHHLIFHGKTHYFYGHGFNSYGTNYQRVPMITNDP